MELSAKLCYNYKVNKAFVAADTEPHADLHSSDAMHQFAI